MKTTTWRVVSAGAVLCAALTGCGQNVESVNTSADGSASSSTTPAPASSSSETSTDSSESPSSAPTSVTSSESSSSSGGSGSSVALTDFSGTLVPGSSEPKALAIEAGKAITFVISGGEELSGNAGCNTFTGKAAITGNDLRIKVTGVTRTLCNGGGVMEAENAYLETLADVTSYSLVGNTLTLKHSAGVLTFTQK